MRYGYCTGFASMTKDRVDDRLLADIREAGFDFAELPLMQTAALPEQSFRELARRFASLGLAADASCNMFPPTLRLTGPRAELTPVREYLRPAFDRLTALGTRTLVFGSSGARNLPAGTAPEEGYRQLTELIRRDVIPLLTASDITLVMEPIGSYEANFINTLRDGMEIVRRVNHPRVRLLADSVHLLWEKEDPAVIPRYAEYLRHVHICENKRALPVDGYSTELENILQALKATGYNRTVSFEPTPYPLADMRQALNRLKNTLER